MYELLLFGGANVRMYELFYFVEEIIGISCPFPFVGGEANVRMYELFLFVEADVRMYELFYSLATPKTVLRASGRGFQGKVRKMYEIILKIANVRN